MRAKCWDCVEKHIGQAYVLLSELHAHPEYRLLIIGHFAEAEAECPDPTYAAVAASLRYAMVQRASLPEIADVASTLFARRKEYDTQDF